MIKEGLEDFEGALIDYNKVLSLNQDDGLAYYNRANCRAALNDYGAGISDMDDAIRCEPKNAMYYKQRGNLYYHEQNKEKACFDWRRAVEFGDQKARFQIDQYCK
jgi:tetratricopeptide (TPR) repeat protein